MNENGNKGGEIKRLGELLPKELKTSSITHKLSRVNSEILLAKGSGSGILTRDELKQLFVRVVAMHSIKDVPASEIIDLCYDSWLRKYSSDMGMNKSELALAFQMNVNGDFSVRINHYQSLSLEFFCDVLNQYLSERKEADKKIKQAIKTEEEKLEKARQKSLPVSDVTEQVFEAIIADYKTFHLEGHTLAGVEKTFETHQLFPTKIKVEYLNKIYEVNISEKNIENLRDLARNIVIRSIIRAKSMIDINKFFGAVVSAEHQIVRLKQGKLLNEKDEDLIQAEVSRLLYIQVLALPPSNPDIEESDFVKHVRENIELHKRQK